MFDRENMFSYQQAVSASGPSTDVVFTGHGDVGPGEPVQLEINTPAVTGGGAVTVEVQHADAPGGTWATAMSLPISATALGKGGPVLAATLRTGLKDYLRLNYTLTGTVTGFTPTAGLVQVAQTNR